MSQLIAISKTRSNLPSLIDRISQNLERFLVTVNNQPKAILLSPEEPASLEESAEILSIPRTKASIKRGVKQAKKARASSFPNYPKCGSFLLKKLKNSSLVYSVLNGIQSKKG